MKRHLLLAVSLLVGLTACSGKQQRPAELSTLGADGRTGAQRLAEERREEHEAHRQGMLARLAARRGEDVPAQAPAPGEALAGMVGQINGRPLYADDVFEPRDAQLRALSQQLDRAAFRREASTIIEGRLRELLTNSLVYGEAERDLNPAEQAGLKQMMEKHREELIRKHGIGSPSLANETLLREQGKTLSEVMEEYRQRVVISRYVRERVLPKINVTRRDVERYYRSNPQEFDPPQTFTVRLIRTSSETEAQQARTALDEGQSFTDLAGSAANAWKPEEAGLLAEKVTLEGVREGVLRETAEDLAEAGGGVSQPFAFNDAWWLMAVQDVSNPPKVELKDAMLDIERRLRERQYQALDVRFRQELVREGSYNPLDEMVRDLIEIAMNRYAPGAGG